jgi:hypothetical protein
MAGKTFPGIGDAEDESAPVDSADATDSGATPAPGSPYYSGPTVVDDLKVEEGLQKLRSLDAPSDLLPGDGDSAVDIVESGGHRMPIYTSVLAKDGGRGTMIGHAIVPPVTAPPQPEKPFDDRLRGTLYGHMLHLPDQLVQPTPEEPSERALTIVDRSAPTSHAVEVYQPDVARRSAAGIPQAEAFPVSNRYRSIPIDLEAGSRRKTVVRVLAATGAIAAIVGAALIWLRMNNDEPEPIRPAVVTQPAQPAPAVVPPPSAPATAPAAVVVQPLAAPTTPVVQPPLPGTARPAPERARTTATLRPASPPSATPARAERHHPVAGEAPAKPRATKHQVEDDPDGTLAPSIQ